MQIAIKISQSYYDQIKSTEDFYLSSLEKAIKNGTPLPKGIEAESEDKE